MVDPFPETTTETAGGAGSDGFRTPRRIRSRPQRPHHGPLLPRRALRRPEIFDPAEHECRAPHGSSLSNCFRLPSPRGICGRRTHDRRAKRVEPVNSPPIPRARIADMASVPRRPVVEQAPRSPLAGARPHPSPRSPRTTIREAAFPRSPLEQRCLGTGSRRSAAAPHPKPLRVLSRKCLSINILIHLPPSSPAQNMGGCTEAPRSRMQIFSNSLLK